jgi:hypothetical protein
MHLPGVPTQAAVVDPVEVDAQAAIYQQIVQNPNFQSDVAALAPATDLPAVDLASALPGLGATIFVLDTTTGELLDALPEDLDPVRYQIVRALEVFFDAAGASYVKAREDWPSSASTTVLQAGAVVQAGHDFRAKGKQMIAVLTVPQIPAP